MKQIERAQKLLGEITYIIEEGYYIRKNGNDEGGLFCKSCIKDAVKAAREDYKKCRQEIIDRYRMILETGQYDGKEISNKEIRHRRRYELKNYPMRVTFEVEDCDPDFSGGSTYPYSCDDCGKYFYTNFEPDMECAEMLRNDLGDGKNIDGTLKWQLDTAFGNYEYLDDDVKAILLEIAKTIIKEHGKR